MHNTEVDGSPSGCTNWMKDIIHNIRNAFHGWKLYFTHPVCCAGLALATLFMTVLGVDNITYGFCMAQCITKSVLGGLLGLTAIIGILGSLTFPVLRKKFGLHKTGLIGFISLVAMLTLCVISIELEGSPFEPFYYQTRDFTNNSRDSLLQNFTTLKLNSSTISNTSSTEIFDLDDTSCHVSSFLSVSVFLSGIILARFGLWISDLTVTQALQVSRNIF